MMKKSLLALSVAAAAMGAQAADVQVYGLIDTSLSFVSSDADIAGHDRVNSFSMENAKEFGSRFGLKGSEDLGNGYKVAFVLESGIKSDDGSLDQERPPDSKRIPLFNPLGNEHHDEEVSSRPFRGRCGHGRPGR